MQHHPYALSHLDRTNLNRMTIHQIFDQKNPEKTVALVTAEVGSTAADQLMQCLNANAAIPKLAQAGVPGMLPFPAVLCRLMDVLVHHAYPVLNDDDTEESVRKEALSRAIGDAMTILGIYEQRLQAVHGDSLDWLAEIHNILEPEFPHWYYRDGDAMDGANDGPDYRDEFLKHVEGLTLADLTEMYRGYCKREGLPEDKSADEQQAVTPEQTKWLLEFEDLWDVVKERETAQRANSK
jgi:hypothetical protein